MLEIRVPDTLQAPSLAGRFDSDAFSFQDLINAAILGLVAFGPSVALKSQLDPLLNHAENTVAFVWNDTDPLKGVYKKLGAAGGGSWLRIGVLPHATITGFVSKGAWATATAYDVIDIVEHNGSSYIAIDAHTSGGSTEPGVGASWETVWALLAQRGASAGHQFEYDSVTTDADPGPGTLRFNHATPASATQVYVDIRDRFNELVTDWITSLDDGGSPTDRGIVTFTDIDDDSNYVEFKITGSVVVASGYLKLDLVFLAGGGTFVAGDVLTITATRRGLDAISALPMAAEGAWDVGTAYVANDLVDHNGSSYVALQATTGDEPPNATYWALVASAGESDFAIPPAKPSLSATAADPENDLTGIGSVWLHPYRGVRESFFDGSANVLRNWVGILELDLVSPEHAANTNYDVFSYWNGTAVAVGTGPAWTSDTGRGTGAGTTEVVQNLVSGLWRNVVSMTVRNGAATAVVAAGRGNLLCTIRTDTVAGTTTDSVLKRYVSSLWHPTPKNIVVTQAGPWDYSTATFRIVNGSANNRARVVNCIAGRNLFVVCEAIATTAGDPGPTIELRTVNLGVGINSATVNSAQSSPNQQLEQGGGSRYVSARYRGRPGIGYHEISGLEKGSGGATEIQTWNQWSMMGEAEF